MPSNGNNNKHFLLRLGEFNAENLADTSEFVGEVKLSARQVDTHVEWVAQQLRQMRCAIVGFQEVVNAAVLKRAIDQSGMYNLANIVSAENAHDKKAVALLSIYPIVEKSSILKFPPAAVMHVDKVPVHITEFTRPVLRCVVKLTAWKDQLISVFVCHLKSKKPVVEPAKRHDQKLKAVGYGISTVIRAAEAAALRHLLVDEMLANPGRPVVVIGGLNDVVHSVSTEIITGTKPWKKLPAAEKTAIWDLLLHSVTEIQVRNSDRDVYFSHIHNGRYEVLDHILVNKEFCQSYPKHIAKVQYVQYLNDHLRDATLQDEVVEEGASDHGQVVCQIKFNLPT